MEQSQEKQFMPHVTDEERLRIMNSNFDRIEESYTKILTEDELTVCRKELDKLIIDIDVKEEELAAYTKPRKDEIKQKKHERKALSEVTRFGQMDVTGELFIMKDFSQRMAYLRNDTGVLVKMRPLTHEEIQGDMFN